MRAGGSGRVDESDPESRKKEDPFDFALWKGAKEDEPSWDSPWGKGRPGWHIECSAMIRHQLGETIDIHGGGGDLVFPHHENEIAQSEGAHDHPLANYWLHNGMVTVNGEKMSKSLGNFTTIRDLLGGGVSPMAIRLFVLTAQYRKPIDFNDEAIKSAESSWQTIKEGLLFGYQYGEQLGWSDPQEIPLVEPILTEFPPQENVFVENPLQSIDIKPIIGEEVLSSFQKILRGLFLPFIKFPDYFHRFIQEYRQYAIIALLLYLSQFPIRITLGFLESINSLPLVSELFETVGLLVIGRYLLYKSVREKTNSQIQELITKITTKPTDVDNSKSSSNKYIDRFQRAIDDDFNFAEGLAVIFELAKDLRKEGNLLVHQGKTQTAPQILKTHWETLLLLTNVLGLEVDVTEINQNNHDGLSDGEIEDLITQRKIARDNKDFSTSDRIRDELKAQGITLIDQSGGITTWHR
jgi:cysteinyl-tRNA synthetase